MDAGDYDADYYLGLMYIDGKFVEKDRIKGLDLIAGAADKGSLIAADFMDDFLQLKSCPVEEVSVDSEQ